MLFVTMCFYSFCIQRVNVDVQVLEMRGKSVFVFISRVFLNFNFNSKVIKNLLLRWFVTYVSHWFRLQYTWRQSGRPKKPLILTEGSLKRWIITIAKYITHNFGKNKNYWTFLQNWKKFIFLNLWILICLLVDTNCTLGAIFFFCYDEWLNKMWHCSQ